MRNRRPLAGLFTAAILLGSGAATSACLGQQGEGQQPVVDLEPAEADRENFPDVSNQEIDQDTDQDTQGD